ncbi:MAG: CsgG/HfaB family protein [Deltaproteobacteria bacterium]|nr:CsgG/HfaB family protein [Deltaproteobacteria bacterium]
MGRFIWLSVFLVFQVLCCGNLLAEQTKTKIAVLDFTVQGKGLDQDLGKIVSDWFITSLVKNERFEVVERGTLKRILDEQALAMSGIVDEQTATRAGKMLGVNVLITGSVVRLGERIEITARGIDIETAAVLAAESEKAENLNGLMDSVNELSVRLVRTLSGMLSRNSPAKQQTGFVPQGKTSILHLSGLVASEKASIFHDPRVLGLLQQHGMLIDIGVAGSREMLSMSGHGGYDFVFPSGGYLANEIAKTHHADQTYNIFYTPIIVASWKPVADILIANGAVEERNGVYYLKMRKILPMIADGKRWSDLRNNKAYPSDKPIFITSTDVATSNSGAMYLSIASYVSNDNKMPETDGDIERLSSMVQKFFTNQGSQAVSSKEPFDDYLSMGMGRTPMVIAYESQFLEAVAKGATTADMVMLYPEPTIYVKGVVVPLTEDGKKVGEFLMEDAAFSKIATEYGYHIKNARLFRETFNDKGVQLPDSLISVINPLNMNVMNRMITTLTSVKSAAR